jgi:hypothetical protein
MEPEGSLLCSQEPYHGSISWVKRIQSITSHPVSLRSILLSSHLSVRLNSCLFPSHFYITLRPLLMRATCPASFILLHLLILIIPGEEYGTWTKSLNIKIFPKYYVSHVQIYTELGIH